MTTNSKEAFIGTVTGSIRAEQKARVLEEGGRVLKFTNNGGKLYFRYYFPHPETLTWNKLTNGLRVLFSITSTDVYVRYTDVDGTKIMVNDDSGLRIMFDEMRATDVIRIEVIADGAASNTTSIHNIDDLAGSLDDGGPKMSMPMPMPMPPSGFPRIDPSRPPSAMSNHTSMARPPMQSAMPQGYARNDNASMSTLPPPKPQQPLK
ncbi:hypothetical protein LPJ72_003378 [Coemansia sp. Benny D160-2]|nr:hypothetical protein LPJ72_003378 [Coemansia sp. Benny D160-2]